MSYTLRDLPLPVKVVATVFLLAVGAGYTSAMLQLHVQDSKSGKPMPTPDDVILKFTGKKLADPKAPPPHVMSRLEALVVAEQVAIAGNSMSAAFTTEDRAPKGPLKYADAVRGQLAEVVEQVKAERKGEQAVFALWINTPDSERKAAYAANRFVPPAGTMPKAFTPLLTDGGAVKIKTLIDVRCVTCHSKGGDKEDVPLDNYESLSRFMTVPEAAPATSGWVKVEEPISITKLTQSTHAHLLSFAVLFSLTGLLFALSSWPTWVRVIVGPSVVIAVFADVSLWWLARLCDEWGPYFALGVMGTGALAGMGLGAQITLSLFNMYGPKGKVAIALLFLVGALAGGGFVMKLLIPALPKPKVAAPEPPKPAPVNGNGKTDPVPVTGKGPADAVAAAGAAVAEAVAKAQAVAVARKPVTPLEKLLMYPPVLPNGDPIPAADVKFNGTDEGSMVPAFFDREKDLKFPNFMKGDAPQAEKDKLRAHRQGDLDVMLAWVRSPEPARKTAYESDAFSFPGLSDKLVTPELVNDGKVRIKSLIDNRCVTCHREGDRKAGDYPLDTYKALEQYLKPYDAPK